MTFLLVYHELQAFREQMNFMEDSKEDFFERAGTDVPFNLCLFHVFFLAFLGQGKMENVVILIK